MLSNLVTSLFENGRIQTTEAKAKEGRRLAERLVTFAKRGDLHARRQVLKTISDKTVVKRLFDDIGPRFAKRPGGYTRIVKLGPRLGDRAPMVLFELLGEPMVSEKKEKKEKSAETSKGKTEKKAKGKRRPRRKEKAPAKMAPADAGLEGKRKSKMKSSKKPAAK
jgi:large subunit ribosomal protein L17